MNNVLIYTRYSCGSHRASVCTADSNRKCWASLLITLRKSSFWLPLIKYQFNLHTVLKRKGAPLTTFRGGSRDFQRGDGGGGGRRTIENIPITLSGQRSFTYKYMYNKKKMAKNRGAHTPLLNPVLTIHRTLSLIYSVVLQKSLERGLSS